jgi:MOSC domain-containing protein YiiM
MNKNTPEPPVLYESYLLRLRRTTSEGEPVCQVTLICLPCQKAHYFADLEKLTVFLAQGGEKEDRGQA